MMMSRGSAARAPQRRAPAKPKRPELRVVDPNRERIRPARVGTIAGALLFLALFALAAFQTVLIRAQAHLDDVNSQVAQQSELHQQLELQLADLQSPERIAQVARDRLGMIAPNTVTFLQPTPQDDANAQYVAPPPTAAPPTTAAPKPATPKSGTATSTTKKSTASTTSTTAPKPSPTTTTPKKSTTTKAGATGQ